jgi:hypothetical protein
VPNRHARDARDLLVRETKRVPEHDGDPLVVRQARERDREVAPKVGENGEVGGIGLIGGRLLVELERLGAADALEGHAVPACVHDQAVEPRGELSLPAELLQPGADLDEGLLRRVPRLLQVAHELRGKPVDSWRVSLDKRVERAAVTVRCLVHEL